MKNPSKILSQYQHRPFPYPESPWAFYQEWHDAVFLHWAVPVDILQKLVPKGLAIDTYNDMGYISLVAFTAENSRPRILPPVPHISHFLEINIRTYVLKDGVPGIYFLNMEASRILSALAFRGITGFPYAPAQMMHHEGHFISVDDKKHHYFEVKYQKANHRNYKKSALDSWLAERYCVYLDRFGKMLRYDVHHEEWPLQPAEVNLQLKYKLGDYILNDPNPTLAHYSKGVEVVGWLPKIYDL
ncbi:MAG TPA: DUF2071 domain-containing protein [Anditalea sp.]|nr:DUF2071 domain-containing protein [Anditalea sp.]